MLRARQFILTGTSPAAAGTALVGAAQGGLERYSGLRIDAIIIGGTGGTVDLYLQRWLTTGIWLDWCHFPQVAAGVTKLYSCLIGVEAAGATSSIIQVGQTTDDPTVGALVLPANTFIGAITDKIRMVAVAGAGTSAGAVQTVYVTGHELYT